MEPQLTTDANPRASMGQPAMIGGLVIGVLSSLPIISAGNVCCCLWVVAGGAVAAYLLQQNQRTPITPGDGALVGLYAGLIGAAVGFVISIPLSMVMAPMQRAVVQRILENAGDMPPAARQILENMSGPTTAAGLMGRLVIRVVIFCFTLVIWSIFSTLGGLLGAAIFKKSAPPVQAQM
jgi:hypothetical protein